jgi:hypothetical protein
MAAMVSRFKMRDQRGRPGHLRFIRDFFADSKACQLAGVRFVLSKNGRLRRQLATHNHFLISAHGFK